MSKLVAFRLSSDHEIVGRLEQEDEQSVIMSKVRSVILNQGIDPNTKQEALFVDLIPYFFSNPDATIRVNRNQIVAEAPMGSEIEKLYIKNTTSLQLLS